MEKKNSGSIPIVVEAKSFFYKKENKTYVPIEDKVLNQQAKTKLDQLFKKPEKYHVPQRLIENWDDVVLFNAKGDLQKAKSLLMLSENSAYDLSNPLNDLLAKEWLPETVSVFAQKGLGAGSKGAAIEKLHPAPFSFQDVARQIKFFTKEGEKVLDPFVGVGSTLKACCFENRIGYGIELSKKYADLSKLRIEQEVPDDMKFKNQQKILNSNCLQEINNFTENYFDFLITSPPYWNILETKDHKANERVVENLDTKYSDDDNDLANIQDYDVFLDTLSAFFSDCSRIIKPKKYMAIIVSDFRRLDKFVIFHADLAKAIEEKSKFRLKGIKILYQRHKRVFPYGYPFSFVPNVHHQNVLIFQNSK
jgi:DNA modification methylase